MEWASLIISIISLLISGISFFRYDRKIKKQNLILNQYQIQEIEKERIKKKCANISGEIKMGKSNGMRKLIISNKGLAPARNINMTDIRNFRGILLTGMPCFPFDLLNPGEHIEIPFMISESTPDNINMEYTWDDDNKVHNIYKQNLKLQ